MPALIQKLARPGLAFNGVLVAVIAVLAALIGTIGIPKQPEVAAMSNMELRAALMSCGLTPGPLAAAGVTPQETTALVTAARAHLGSRIQFLRDAHESVQDANQALASLETMVRHGTAGENPAGQLSTAQGNITSSIAARQDLWSEVFEAAAGNIAPERLLVIQAVQGNSAWKLPTEYLVSSRSEAAWVALRDALDNIRVAAQLGEEPSGEAVQLVQAVDAETAVAQARVNLGNLPAVSAAWELATLPPE